MAKIAKISSPPIAEYKRAMGHFEKNELDKASTILDGLIKSHPNFFEAWHLLGVVALKTGANADAQTYLERAVAIRPKAEVAVNNLGTAYLQQSKLNEAADHYRKAIALKPDYSVAHNHLGSVLLLEDRIEDAIGAFRRASLLDKKNSEAVNNLAAAYSKLERYEDAESAYRAALALKPFYPQAHCNLGGTLVQLGRFEEARNSFITAIAMNNRYGEPYQTLAYNHKFDREDGIGKMLVRAEGEIEEFPPFDRIFVHFALGKYYNDLKQPDAAFKHLSQACTRKRQTLEFDIEKAEARMGEIADAYPAGDWSDVSDVGHDSKTPIFIVGMPRSGTTLIEQILASHPDVHGAGEITTLSKVRKHKEEIWFPDLNDKADRADLRESGEEYVTAVQSRAPEASRITDKMPHNFRYLGLLHLMLPKAKIIHCVRHPVDTCLSCFQQHFAEGQAWCYDLAELGRYYVAYHKLMDHWRRVLPAGRILDVNYESVVADLDPQARRLVDHCGLDWDDSCLAFYENKRAVRTASQAQVREPIYDRSVGRWKPYEKHLGPLLGALSPVLEEAS